MTGTFVVLEGIDGSGTTTASKLLVQRLNSLGIEAVWTKEPSDGTIGRHIRRILRGEESASEEAMFPMFLADRHDHISSQILPELVQGSWVVCDRYTASSWVYQQDTYCADIIEMVQKKCLTPDVLFVLEASAETCQRRLAERGGVKERYDDLEKQRKFAKLYYDVPASFAKEIHFVDTEEVDAEGVVDAIMELLKVKGYV